MKISFVNKLVIGSAGVLVSGALYSAAGNFSYLEKNDLNSAQYTSNLASEHYVPKASQENKCYFDLHLEMVGAPFAQQPAHPKLTNEGCTAKASNQAIES